MLDILGAEDRDRLPLSISFEDPGDLEHGERAPSFLGDERNGVAPPTRLASSSVSERVTGIVQARPFSRCIVSRIER